MDLSAAGSMTPHDRGGCCWRALWAEPVTPFWMCEVRTGVVNCKQTVHRIGVGCRVATVVPRAHGAFRQRSECCARARQCAGRACHVPTDPLDQPARAHQAPRANAPVSPVLGGWESYCLYIYVFLLR
jgi:hypothetical protein